MNNGLEKILNFEGQEIKVKTDQGVELFNLANSARVLGLTIKDKKRGTERPMWKGGRSIFEKLTKIKANLKEMECEANASHQYMEEINYVLDEIENGEDRNAIYMSRYLTSLLAMECNSPKATEYKSWLAKLDENYSKGTLDQINPLQQLSVLNQSMVGFMNNLSGVLNNIETYVKDSINVKDTQIDAISDLIGVRDINVKKLTKTLKEKVQASLGRKVWSNNPDFIEAKEKVFARFDVTAWEQIPAKKYDEVKEYIEEEF